MSDQFLLIGTKNGLSGPPGDVDRMEATLRPFGFDIIRCEEKCATVPRIIDHIADLFSTPGRKGIYNTGHGTDSGKYQGWVVWKGVLWDYQLIEAIDAGYKPDQHELYVLVDTCYAYGTVLVDGVFRGRNGEKRVPKSLPIQAVKALGFDLGGVVPGRTIARPSRMVDLDQRAKAIVMASCGVNELSTETRDKGGVFTYEFCFHASKSPRQHWLDLTEAVAGATRRYDQTCTLRASPANAEQPLFSREQPLIETYTGTALG